MDDEKYIVRAGDVKLAGLREIGHIAASSNHKYIVFKDNPVKGANTQAGFIVIEHLFGQIKSNQKWYKDNIFMILIGQILQGKHRQVLN